MSSIEEGSDTICPCPPPKQAQAVGQNVIDGDDNKTIFESPYFMYLLILFVGIIY